MKTKHKNFMKKITTLFVLVLILFSCETEKINPKTYWIDLFDQPNNCHHWIQKSIRGNVISQYCECNGVVVVCI